MGEGKRTGKRTKTAPKIHQFGQVRTVQKDGEPWFVAADVCRALEIEPTATRRLDDDEKSAMRLTQTSSNGVEQGRDVTIVNEPGLYSLVLGSRKPEAKSFKRWITHEVIPSIRRHGFPELRQNRDKSATKNTTLPLSQRVKTVSKVRQKSSVARCHGVAKPWQKWGKSSVVFFVEGF